MSGKTGSRIQDQHSKATNGSFGKNRRKKAIAFRKDSPHVSKSMGGPAGIWKSRVGLPFAKTSTHSLFGKRIFLLAAKPDGEIG